MFTIPGHHHISMLTKNAKENNQFYRNILGLRRVKVTVNQDNPSMYHLFYGDRTGSPGTELSFFEMPLIGRTYRGTNAITQIGLIVPSEESLQYWQARFEQLGVQHGPITTYAQRPALHFEDSEGLRMVLIAANGAKVAHWETWDKSPVPVEHQIQGMGTVEITVKRVDKLIQTLTNIFGYIVKERSDTEAILQSLPNEVFGEIIVKYMDGPSERPGKGSVHHLAIRVRNLEELQYWDAKVKAEHFETSGIIDRYYFQSLYFRESNGILFEIATDGPGFTIDGDVETLGKRLDLPPLFEARRAEIEAQLQPIDEENE